jgi:hypothetical protein
MQEEYCRLLDVSRNTYYVHKRENRPIVALLEKYFSKEELEEFLETGKIARLEKDAGYSHDINLIKSIVIDDAIYSAKEKLQKLEKNVFEWVYNKGALEILKEILTSIKVDDFNMDNAKDVLFALVKGYDANWLSLKNPGKQKLLSAFIEKNLSKSECYAICKYSDEVFNYKGYFEN